MTGPTSPNKDLNEWASILKLLLETKNCILKYGDEHEDISDILKWWYLEIGKQEK